MRHTAYVVVVEIDGNNAALKARGQKKIAKAICRIMQQAGCYKVLFDDSAAIESERPFLKELFICSDTKHEGIYFIR